MGVIVPDKEYIQNIRQLCDDHNVLLILMKSWQVFVLHPEAHKNYFGVEADLTCLGKIIGGGMPVGAYGGKKRSWKNITTKRTYYQVYSTLSGNPVCMAASIKTLKLLKDKGLYQTLAIRTQFLVTRWKNCSTMDWFDCTVCGLNDDTIFTNKNV